MTISGRLIGSDQILPVMTQLYGLTTWRGVLNFTKRNNLPMSRTGKGRRDGKPLLIIHDLIEYELQNGRSITVNEIVIK